MKETPCSQKELENRRELPIGIFDSGVGGLTVVREVSNLLPRESVIYLGDTARVPYGNKSRSTILRFTQEAISFFRAKKVKMLLIACNTSSSLALPFLEKSQAFPVYGVIEPGVKEALKVTRIKRIGVIGTRATIASNIYSQKLKKLDPEVLVYSKACPLFVPLVEEGWFQDPLTYKIAERYLYELRKERVDALILGCTHYPLIKNVIKYVMGETVALIDSAEAFVRMIKDLLSKAGLEKREGSKVYEFYVTDEPAQFKKLSALFLNNITEVTKIELEDYKDVSDFSKIKF